LIARETRGTYSYFSLVPGALDSMREVFSGSAAAACSTGAGSAMSYPGIVPSSSPGVELLWWVGCPSWEQARHLVREEMAAAGLDPERLEVRELRTDEEAAREGFPGSPTVRVDGRDIQDAGEGPIGLTCRVYRLRDGRISALPDPADVRDALRASGLAPSEAPGGHAKQDAVR